MGKDIEEHILWNQHERMKRVRKLTDEAITKAIWQAELTEYQNEMIRIEFESLTKEFEIENFPEAEICIRIAKWRANALMRKMEREDMLMDAYIQLRDMLSKLRLENGLIIDPRAERRIIDHYNRPRRLREKFRDKTMDTIISIWVARSEYEYEFYMKFRKKLFPYLPPYDLPSQ
jgi:hypothetical protein